MKTNRKITPDTTIEITFSTSLKDAPEELRRLFLEKIRKEIDALVLDVESLEDSEFSVESSGNPLPHPVPISILESLENHSISAALFARECRQQLVQLAEIQQKPSGAPKSSHACSGSECASRDASSGDSLSCPKEESPK